jgi:hypothetical protein
MKAILKKDEYQEATYNAFGSKVIGRCYNSVGLDEKPTPEEIKIFETFGYKVTAISEISPGLFDVEFTK